MPHDMPPPANDPVPLGQTRSWVPMIAVRRGPAVESRHDGAAVVADAAGRVVAAWGDLEQPVYARSAIKPVQALAVVESGAADAFALTTEELALACASHAGTPAHTGRVAAWLARLGLGLEALECGAHRPNDQDTADAMVAAGITPSGLHNNCSGKHAGMLTTAQHTGVPLPGYGERTHPVQQRILGILEMMTGQDLSDAPVAPDGCNIPTFAISLGGLAVAMARMVDTAALPDRRAAAAARICRAWAGHPDLVHGPGRSDSLMLRAFAGTVLVKRGAEGVYCAAVPGAGLGLALKIADGAERAAAPALLAILDHLGLLTGEAAAALAGIARPVLANRRGVAVGSIGPAEGFPA